MSTRQINDQIDMLFDKKLTAIGQVGEQKVNEVPQIKSEKAKALLESSTFHTPKTKGAMLFKAVYNAAAIAESEAHDRAVEEFKRACSCGRSDSGGIGGECTRFTDCERFKCFINELNK